MLINFADTLKHSLNTQFSIFVFTDSERKDLSVKATSTLETVEQTYMHSLPKRRPDLSNNGIAWTENAEDEMSTASTEDHRRQMDRHLSRCVQRHQALLE